MKGRLNWRVNPIGYPHKMCLCKDTKKMKVFVPYILPLIIFHNTRKMVVETFCNVYLVFIDR